VRLAELLDEQRGLPHAHHENPGLHWSKLPQAHAAIAHRIHPELKRRSIIGYCLGTYVLGAVCDRFRTRPIGIAPRRASRTDGGRAAANAPAA